MCAAIAQVPARVDIERLQVGQPPDLLGALRLAAGERPKRIEIDGRGPLRLQVRVEKRHVAVLVIGVVADVLRQVLVEVLQRGRVGTVAALDASELVVLRPQIGFDQLGSGKEAQDVDVATGDPGRLGNCLTREQRAARQCGSTGNTDPLQERASTDHALPQRMHVVSHGHRRLRLVRNDRGGFLGHGASFPLGICGQCRNRFRLTDSIRGPPLSSACGRLFRLPRRRYDRPV